MGYFLSIKSLFFERIIGELLEHKRRFLRWNLYFSNFVHWKMVYAVAALQDLQILQV